METRTKKFANLKLELVSEAENGHRSEEVFEVKEQHMRKTIADHGLY